MKVSVIIPMYNAQQYVANCLECFINQTYGNIEIIVINDGSSDDSLYIALQYQKADNRIKIIDQPNQGACAARQAGVDCATGEYLYFQDIDDYSTIDAIESLVSQIPKTDADIVVGDYMLDSFYTKTAIPNITPIKTTVSGIDYIMLILQGKSFTSLWAKLIRKKLFDSVVAMLLKIGEDTVILTQLAYRAQKVAKVNKVIYTYVMREGSATQKRSLNHLNDYLNSLVWVCNFIKNTKVKILEDILPFYMAHEYGLYLLNNGRIGNYNQVEPFVFYNCTKELPSLPLKSRLTLKCYMISPILGKISRALLSILIKTKRDLVIILK